MWSSSSFHSASSCGHIKIEGRGLGRGGERNDVHACKQRRRGRPVSKRLACAWATAVLVLGDCPLCRGEKFVIYSIDSRLNRGAMV